MRIDDYFENLWLLRSGTNSRFNCYTFDTLSTCPRLCEKKNDFKFLLGTKGFHWESLVCLRFLLWRGKCLSWISLWVPLSRSFFFRKYSNFKIEKAKTIFVAEGFSNKMGFWKFGWKQSKRSKKMPKGPPPMFYEVNCFKKYR